MQLEQPVLRDGRGRNLSHGMMLLVVLLGMVEPLLTAGRNVVVVVG
jgi:hypothetical protein